MTDLRMKRKYAGAPVRELRKIDQDPMRLPPHKKPKVWGLMIGWTETITYQRQRTFTSRAARDEARTRIERHFREEAEKLLRQPRKRYRAWWASNSPFSEFSDEMSNVIKEGPKYVETYDDAPREQSDKV